MRAPTRPACSGRCRLVGRGGRLRGQIRVANPVMPAIRPSHPRLADRNGPCNCRSSASNHSEAPRVAGAWRPIPSADAVTLRTLS
jgi:hypothetical protein